MPRITDFCSCIYVFGCKLSLLGLCDSDFGITPADDITIGITCAAFCFHIAHISFAKSWYLFCLSVIALLLLLLLLFYISSSMQIISEPCLSIYHFFKRKISHDLFTALKEETHRTKCCLLETNWMPTCVKTMRGRPHWSGLIWAMTAILDCILVSPMVSMLLSRGICTLS